MPTKVVCLQNTKDFKFKLSLDYLKISQRSYYNLPNSAFCGRLSVESRPQNPEFRNNPEIFHPFIFACYCRLLITFVNSLDQGQAQQIIGSYQSVKQFGSRMRSGPTFCQS